VIADFDEPIQTDIVLPGVELESSTGTRLIFAVDEVGPLISQLTQIGALRDLSIAEPEIEDVISRLYLSR
jgi:ABC-2 type transport system ATP-binding protein